MKEIFAYVGSRMGNNSNTLKYVKGAIDKALESIEDSEVQVNVYTAADIKINYCKGCLNCFVNGSCPMDSIDDMKAIKEKMLNADMIIFASPVYVHHVSGDTKVFLDRLGVWYHLLRLAGKPGIAVVTSGGNGLELTYNYLYKVMSYLGIKVVGKFGIAPYTFDEEYYNSVESFSKLIAEYLNNGKIESDNILESVFKASKQMIELSSAIKPAEYEYWEKSGLLKCNTFEEVLSVINCEAPVLV